MTIEHNSHCPAHSIRVNSCMHMYIVYSPAKLNLTLPQLEAPKRHIGIIYENQHQWNPYFLLIWVVWLKISINDSFLSHHASGAWITLLRAISGSQTNILGVSFRRSNVQPIPEKYYNSDGPFWPDNLIMSAAFSATAITVAQGCPETCVGKIDASTIRKPVTPWTLSWASTTLEEDPILADEVCDEHQMINLSRLANLYGKRGPHWMPCRLSISLYPCGQVFIGYLYLV